MAIKLARALGTSAQLWLNLQASYDLSQVSEPEFDGSVQKSFPKIEKKMPNQTADSVIGSKPLSDTAGYDSRKRWIMLSGGVVLSAIILAVMMSGFFRGILTGNFSFEQITRQFFIDNLFAHNILMVNGK